ncbi:MAG: DUF2004 domain-containing protein [Pseudomonadota bacterium]
MEPLHEVYEAEAPLHGGSVRIWLTFWGASSIAGADWPVVRSFLNDLPTKAELARNAIRDQAHEQTVRRYLQHHIKHGILDAEIEAAEMITAMNVNILVAPLERSTEFAVFDFSIDPECTDELLVVRMGPDGSTAPPSWES